MRDMVYTKYNTFWCSQ